MNPTRHSLKLALQIICCLLVLTAGPAFGQAPAPTPVDEYDLQVNLAKDLKTWTNDAICSHHVHIILMLDTTQYFAGSNGYKAFVSAWEEMQNKFFVAGDRITVKAFGHEVLPAKPDTQKFADGNKLPIQDWFDQVPKAPGKGTYLQMALLNALTTGQGTTDPDCITLVLMVAPETKSDGDDKIAAADDSRRPQTLAKAKEFSDDIAGISTPTLFKAYPRLGDHVPGKLYIWHAMEKNWHGKPESSPIREIGLPPSNNTPEEAPPDTRGRTRIIGLTLLILSPLGWFFMRSKVTVTFGNLRKTIVIPIWHRVPVSVCTTISDDSEPDVVLLLPNASGHSETIGEISLKVPGSATWDRLRGFLADEDGQTDALPLPYGATKQLQVWTDSNYPDQKGTVSVTPAPWMEGKTGGVIWIITVLLAALIVFGYAAQPLPTPIAVDSPTECALCKGECPN